VRKALLSTARTHGSGWDEKYGYGHLDLGAALGASAGAGVDATRFALGAAFALLVGQLAATRRRFQVGSAVVAGLTAGGLFLLPLLPVHHGVVLRLLASPLLEWPAHLVGPSWVQFPLWLSAMVPALVAFTAGASARSRWLALGLACGVGAHLLHGAATDTLAPWWFPPALGTIWLLANATGCLLLGLGLAGVHKLEETKA
jgi:hypothetical protein